MSTIANKEVPPTAGAYVGYNVVLTVGGEELSRVQRMNFRVNNNIQQIYVVSSRTPLNLPRGFNIRGTIRRLYFNTAFLRLAIGRQPSDIPSHGTMVDSGTIAGWMGADDTGTPPFTTPDDFRRIPELEISASLNIEHDASTPVDQFHTITLKGVKLNDFELSFEANEAVLENVTFFAESLAVTFSD